MAVTENYSLKKPSLGNQTTWGVDLNANMDAIDTLLKALSDAIDAVAAPAELIYPVGALYFSTLSTNPATLLGFGTWAAFAAGRAIVGVGTADSLAWAAAEEKGVATHTLTSAELPTHRHGAGSLTTSDAGSHNHTAGTMQAAGYDLVAGDTSAYLAVNYTKPLSNSFQNAYTYAITSGGAGGDTSALDGADLDGAHTHTIEGNTSSAGAHSHSLSGNTANLGDGGAHTNVQPSIAIYIWKRTA